MVKRFHFKHQYYILRTQFTFEGVSYVFVYTIVYNGYACCCSIMFSFVFSLSEFISLSYYISYFIFHLTLLIYSIIATICEHIRLIKYIHIHIIVISIIPRNWYWCNNTVQSTSPLIFLQLQLLSVHFGFLYIHLLLYFRVLGC